MNRFHLTPRAFSPLWKSKPQTAPDPPLMPKLPRLTPRKIISILKKNGFVLDHATGSHYVFYHPETKRRVTVAYHSKDVPKGTLLSILKQAGLSSEDI